MKLREICMKTSSVKSSRAIQTNKNDNDGEEETNERKQIYAAFAMCFVCICGGNLVGYTSSAIPSMLAHNVSRTIDIGDYSTLLRFTEMTESQASWIGSLVPLGAFIGCFLAPALIQRWDLKAVAVKICCPSYIASWLTLLCASNICLIYVGRILGGMSLGISCSISSLYIIENSSVRYRGPLGVVPQFLFTFGVLMSYVIGSILNWREAAMAFCVFSLFCLIVVAVWVPGQNKQSITVPSIAKDATRHPKKLTPLDSDSQQSSRDFSTPSTLAVRIRTTGIALFLCVFQQLTGINAVNFYAVTIFEIAAGDTKEETSLLTEHVSAIIVAACFCFANVLSYIFIESVGRKPLLTFSTIVTSLSSLSLGTYFWILDNDKDNTHVIIQNCSFIPLLSLMAFVLAYSIGYGPLLYLIVTEILPSDVRRVISPAAVGINRLCVFLIAKTFPCMVEIWKPHGAFWLYGMFSMISLIFTTAFLPETKGKTEKEVQRLFTSSSSSSRYESESGNNNSISSKCDSVSLI